jgi:hypothetical protein
MTDPMKMTVFLMLWASPDWLRLSREARNQIATEAMAAAFAEGEIEVRHFDAEAFNARISDVAMITAGRAEDIYFTIERLRDTPLITEGYFKVVEIVPAFEDGFRRFEVAQAAA